MIVENMKKHALEIVIVILLFIVCVLSLKIGMIFFGTADFQDASVKANKTSYDIYKEEKKLATVYDYDGLSTFLMDRFDSKINTGDGRLYFGEDISVVERFTLNTNTKDSIATYEYIANEADFKVNAIRLHDAQSQKDYFVPNLGVWDNSINKIGNAISSTSGNAGGRVTLQSEVEYEQPTLQNIDDVYDEHALISELMNEEDNKYITANSTSLEAIAQETGRTSTELEVLNSNLNKDDVIMSGVEIELNDANYQSKFTTYQPFIEQQAIPYEIKYIEDAEQYTGVEQIVEQGEDGIAEYRVTVKQLPDGTRIETAKDRLRVIKHPKDHVVIRGTKYAPDVGTGEFIWPVTSRRVSTEFGIDYLWGNERFHSALDINEGYGAPIWAIDNGVVAEVGFNSGYGNYVIINHNNGFWSLYAHNQENLVRVGQVVPKGETIALMGSTGMSTGPHLHLEIRHGANTKEAAVDPRIYIS